jgi:hypothetical protein
MPLPAPPPAPLYAPNSPEIQTALAALARIRELSADCDTRPNSQAAARDFRRGLVEAIDALSQAVLQTAWRTELALTAVIDDRHD